MQLSGLFYALICAYSIRNDSCMQFGYGKQKNMVFEFMHSGGYNITKG
jgi:hypothetical protein